MIQVQIESRRYIVIGLWQTRQAGWTRTGEKKKNFKRSQFIKNKRKKYKEDDFLSGF